MERSRFLARLHRSLADALPAASPAHPPPPFGAVAAPTYRRSLDNLSVAFVEQATVAGARVRRVPLGGIGRFLAEVVAAHDVRRAVVSRDAEVATAPSHLAALEVEVAPQADILAAVAADLAVTGAAFGIAATGSIVVTASRAGARSISLLPPVHAALVPESSLLATPSDLWRQLPRWFPEGLPSQIVLITGPSKTSDIELVLITGVHGPRHLWIGLLA